VVLIARARPDTQGVPLTRWSLVKLRDFLATLGADVSAETLRGILHDAGLSHQRTLLEVESGPDFTEKAERVLSLYREPPADGPVCFDVMGPIELIPHQGSGWAPESCPSGRGRRSIRKGGTRYLPRRLPRPRRPPDRQAQAVQGRSRGGAS
jgi:hypothetical protein